MPLKRVVAVVLAAVLAARAAGAGHVVDPSDIEAALQEAGEQRQHDAATLDAFLARPLTAEVGQRIGVDVERLRAQATRLSSDDLRDLAARAQALDVDPAAGGAGRTILYVFLIALLLLVAFVALVVVACYNGGCD